MSCRREMVGGFHWGAATATRVAFQRLRGSSWYLYGLTAAAPRLVGIAAAVHSIIEYSRSQRVEGGVS
jgi:hypothetical protein